MKPSTISSVITVFLLCSTSALAQNTVLSSDFDDGTLQGWTPEPAFDGELFAESSGGNPNGYMVTTDTAEGGQLWARAPGLHGNLSALQEIQWDEFVYDNTPYTHNGTGIVVKGADGTTYRSSTELGALENWNARSVRFDDPTAWTLVSGSSSFQDVMKNVDGLLIDVQTSTTSTGERESGIDNVLVVSAAPYGTPACVLGTEYQRPSGIANSLLIFLPLGVVLLLHISRRKNHLSR